MPAYHQLLTKRFNVLTVLSEANGPRNYPFHSYSLFPKGQKRKSKLLVELLVDFSEYQSFSFSFSRLLVDLVD